MISGTYITVNPQGTKQEGQEIGKSAYSMGNEYTLIVLFWGMDVVLDYSNLGTSEKRDQ